MTDQQLLCDYVNRQSESAFSELVHRHIDFVYSAALRMTFNPHLAEDATQATFMALANSSPQLLERPVLSPWLHRTAQNLAANVVRSEVRRRAREQEAASMNALLSAKETSPWEQVAPHLDAALGQLAEADREALMLRYFERKSALHMAHVLGISPEAAQKRVNRAVERLRYLLSKPGANVSASGLVLVLTANAVQSAPTSLAAAVCAASVAGPVSTSLAITSSKAIVMSIFQKTLIATVVAIIGTAIVYQARENLRLRRQNEALRQNLVAAQPVSSPATSAQEQIDQLSGQNKELARRLAQASANATQLAEARQKAERIAGVYRGLAEQSASGKAISTNDYPTERHVIARLGNLSRQMAELIHQDKTKLSPEERTASDEMKANLAHDFMKLGSLAKQFNQSKDAGGSSADPASGPNDADHSADVMTCLLYGAMNLNEQQFAQTYVVLQKYQQQATEQSLFKEQSTPDAESALKALSDKARAEIQGLLTDEQTKTFEQLSPCIQLVSRKFNISFNN